MERLDERLMQVSSQLQSAANWGTWDLVGGGVIATMAKHSKIDFAKQRARHDQRQLSKRDRVRRTLAWLLFMHHYFDSASVSD